MAVIGFNNADDFKRMNAAVRAHERQRVVPTQARAKYPVMGSGGGAIICGQLSSGMTAADDGRVTPTVFTFKRWVLGVVGGELNLTTDDETGYNRSSAMSGSSGDYVILAKMNGEWNPLHVDPSC